MEPAATHEQYHHFVPRFILRNFLDGVQPPTGPASAKQKKRQRRDGWVNHLVLKTMKVEQRPLSKLFGLVDMYKSDVGDEKDPYHLEKALSKLEGEAADILRRAQDVFQAEEGVLTLTRHERNQVRKFFFLMKYRSSAQYRRFNHASIDTYSEDDKDRLKVYMEEKGFARPKDVWFANLNAFIHVDMDPAGKWTKSLTEEAFADDAYLFLLHVQAKFMAFCSTDSSKREFFIPENAYGVFEGPSSCSGTTGTKGLVSKVWDEYHTFAPVSPTLMVVFRSNLLPLGPKDDAEKAMKALLEQQKQQHLRPDQANSMLINLPISKNVTSYANTKNGRLVAKPGWNGPDAADTFEYRCYPLGPAHVDNINDILLENAYSGTLIAFGDLQTFTAAVRAYLTKMRKGFKIVTDDPDDPRKAYLMDLVKFVQIKSGHVVSPVYREIKVPRPWDVLMFQRVSTAVLGHMLKDKGRHRRLFQLLSKGDIDNQRERLAHGDQVSRIMFFRIKLDAFRVNFSAEKKRKVGDRWREALRCIPVCRVWLYLKVSKIVSGFDLEDCKRQKKPLQMHGPEDDLAEDFWKQDPVDEYVLSREMCALAL